MPELQVPPSINDTRSQALMTLVERLDSLDLTPLLVYRIDSVPASALPFLAWQFDILSPLWQTLAPIITSVDAITDVDALIYIDTLEEGPTAAGTVSAATVIAAQRSLIKMAIELHRYRGTPWSIKTGLGMLGWSTVSILEGQSSWGSSEYPSNEGWAVFRVVIQLQCNQSIDPSSTTNATATVNVFKPARSLLDALIFALPPDSDNVPTPTDALTIGGIVSYQLDLAPVPSDSTLSISVTMPPMQDTYGPAAPIYSAHYRHSGITYGAAEPRVADSALMLNGNAVLEGG